jgi:pyridoxamine 5'-phosphate oxidase family protein
MGLLTEKERRCLEEQKLGRLATSGKTGVPHVIPTGFHLDSETGSIKIGGHAYRGPDRLYVRHGPVSG